MAEVKGPRLAGVLNELLDEAKKDKSVLAVVLFGNRARGEAARDVDVCLVLYPEKSSNGFDKRVEYSTHEKLDVSVPGSAPLYQEAGAGGWKNPAMQGRRAALRHRLRHREGI